MSRDPARVAIRVGVYIVLFIMTAYRVRMGADRHGVPGGDRGDVAAGRGFRELALAAHLRRTPPHRRRIVVESRLPRRISRSASPAARAAAALVLLPPLLFRAAHLVATPLDRPSVGSLIFLVVVLGCGVVGEELLFRGYAFQVLLAAVGPYATILPIGILFALLHSSNPNATWFGLANTAGFGILFGYAYLRSRDLWLPIGLHMGWNFTLPLFGVNLSGLRIM